MYLTAVERGLDVMCVLLRQLLSVAASEAQRVSVAEGGAVEPAGRVLTHVREALASRGAQELQEAQLHDVNGVSIHIHIRELHNTDRQSVNESIEDKDTQHNNTHTHTHL